MYAGKLLSLVLVVLLVGITGFLTIGTCTAAEPIEAPETECSGAGCTGICCSVPAGYGHRMTIGIHVGLANLVWGPLEIVAQPLAYAVEGHSDDVELSNIFLAPYEILAAPFINTDGEETEGLGIVGFVGGVPVGVHKGVMRMLYGAGTLPSAPFGVYTPWKVYWERKRHANFVGIGNILYGPFELVAQPFVYAQQDGNELFRFVRFIEGVPVGIGACCVRITYGVTRLVMSPFDSSVIPPLDKMLKWTGRKGPDLLLPKSEETRE